MVPTINSWLLSQHIPDAHLIVYLNAGHGALFQPRPRHSHPCPGDRPMSTSTSTRIAAGVTAAYLRDLTTHRREPRTEPPACRMTRRTAATRTRFAPKIAQPGDGSGRVPLGLQPPVCQLR